MMRVGVRSVVLARGELDKLEGGAKIRREEAGVAPRGGRSREGKGSAGGGRASQDEAEESDATEEEATRERTTRVGRPRGGMKVAARVGERLCEER